MKKILKISLCALLALAMVFGLAACRAVPDTDRNQDGDAAQPVVPVQTVLTQDGAATDTVTVSASATVSLVPDKASVSFGVTSEEKTADAAQKKNSEAVQKVIDVLKARGVEEKSIRTSGYNMYPRYDWTQDGEQKLIGYTVYTTMTVNDQDIDGLGKLLSACVEAGINRVDSVTFLCSGYDEAYMDALSQAVKAARGKAEVLAGAAGRALYEAVTITEGWQDTSARYSNAATGYEMAKGEADEAAAPMNFQPGETEIQANVTVVFRMGEPMG